MAGKPNGPQKPGRHVRGQLQQIEMDLICADKNISQAAEKDFGAARAQTFIGKALYKVALLLGLGTDDSDNGNGSNE